MKKNIKIFHIAIIPFILSIILYIQYINIPFDHFDIWFERIAYGDYKFEELPQPLQNLNIPVSFDEYVKYRIEYVGRTPGSIFITYLCYKIFGNNPLFWRIFLYLMMFITFYVIAKILDALKFGKIYVIMILIILPALLSRYFIKTISVMYVLSNLFILITVLLELKNSGLKEHNLWKSILGAICILFAVYIRELQATSLFGVLFILLFWHQDKDLTESKFKLNFRRILPYVISGIIYLVLYWGTLNLYERKEYAYTDLLGASFTIEYFYRVILYVFKYIGIFRSAYLGFTAVSIFIFIYAFLKFRKNHLQIKNILKFRIILALLVLIPSAFLIELVDIKTASFTLQIIAGLIIFASFIEIIIHLYNIKFVKIIIFSLVCILVVFQLSYELRNVNEFVNTTISYNKIEDYIKNNLKINGTVEFENIEPILVNSIMSNIYIKGRRDRISYSIQDTSLAGNPVNPRNYYEYYKFSFSNIEDSLIDIRVKRLKNLEIQSNNINSYLIEEINTFSLDEKLIESLITKSEINNKIINIYSKFMYGHSYNFIKNTNRYYISKIMSD